jgi:hypothetical protein
MDRDPAIGLHVDPLGELEVHRALALARARESYPAVPRETLLEYCEAAWEVALKADPRGRDLQGSFDRALLIIAWTQRRSGGRVPLRELIDQTVPRIALEPFISQPAQPGEVERVPEFGVQPDEAMAGRRSPFRLPFTSPIPVGAALAAGVVGIGVLSEAEVIPIAPLQPAGSDEETGGDEVAARAADQRASKQGSDAGAQDSGGVVAGLLPEGVDDAAAQGLPKPDASTAGAAAASAPAAAADNPPKASTVAGRSSAEAAAVQVAAETAGAEAAPPTPVTPPAPPPAQPVVRVEMAPATMILEVTAPQRAQVRGDRDEDASEPQDTSTPDPVSEPPAVPEGDEADTSGEEGREQRPVRDDDKGPLDQLEDLSTPGADGEGDDETTDEQEADEGDADEGAPAPTPPAPVTPAPPAPDAAAPAPAPVEPAPAPVPAPAEPAPAPAPAEPAPAPAASAPAPAAPAPAPAPAAPAPAPTAPPPAA